MNTIHFTVEGEPIGKPRQTRADKWQRRPCVLRYRAWADKARADLYQAAKIREFPRGMYDVSWIAYIGMADSWSAKKKALLAGKPHFGKPDRDNIDKAILDSLFGDDRGVTTGTLSKRWDDGKGPRVEVVITPIEGDLP